MSGNTKKEKDKIQEYDENELEFKIEIATQTLERNIGFVSSCDNKTSIVLAMTGVLLTLILTNEGMDTIFNILTACLETKSFCNVIYLICFVGTVFVMGSGIYKLCLVLVANVDEKAKGISETTSNIFFTGIAKNSMYELYNEKFRKMKKEDLLNELISQIYINANISTQKYKRYNEGLKLTITGFVLFVGVLVIGLYVY